MQLSLEIFAAGSCCSRKNFGQFWIESVSKQVFEIDNLPKRDTLERHLLALLANKGPRCLE